MKVLITGNLGYVGPGVVKEFRDHFPEAELIGYDCGYFMRQNTSSLITAENYLNKQIFGDVRNLDARVLEGVDTVISLAAISNDPLSNQFENQTFDINYKSTIDIAKMSKDAGVKNFIFASSCSVYGFASDSPRKENSDLDPLTPYAKSKVKSEEDLYPLASDEFKITCLRFATACGMSDRLRLDLVVNDFVAGGILNKKIEILSDGTPWRPLINVLDMARAIRWAHERTISEGGNFIRVNTGSNNWNYQVKEIAYSVQKILGDVEVHINQKAAPDKRSYQVNFDLFEKLAPLHQPIFDLKMTVTDLIHGINAIELKNKNFRNSNLIRLHVINQLLDHNIIDNNLCFRK